MSVPAPRRRKRRLRTVLILGLIILAAGAYFGRSWYAPAKAPAIMSAVAARGDIEETVLANGTLKPVKLVAVGAQASGRITAVHVKLGDRVRQGDLIAEIDSVNKQNSLRTAKASVANIKAQIVQAEANYQLALSTLDRQKSVIVSNAISRADLDNAQSEVAVAEAKIAALKAQLEESDVAVEDATANLAYTRITAPTDGTVLSVVSQEGQTVNAAQSAPTIVILGELSTMTVRAEISEADVVRVEPGQEVWFTILGDPDRRYEAVLEQIEPAPESIKSDSSFSTSTSASSSSSSSSSAIYYNGIFSVPNPDGRLRTYMTAEVHIILASAKDVLTVPATALGRHVDGKRYVVRVLGADGKTEPREVETGLNDKVTVEIRSGLSEGDRVVTGEMTGETRSGRLFGGPPMGM